MSKKKKKRKKSKPEKSPRTQERKAILPRKLTPRMEKLLPAIPFVLILVLALAYFAPFFSSDKMMGGSDWMLGEYAKRVWTQDFLRGNRSLPMWLPLIFGGCPTFAAFFGDWFALPHLIVNYFFPMRAARVIYFIGYIFLAGLGTYLFLKEMKLGMLPATFGAICYMFSGSLMSTPYAGHLARAISISLLPLMLLFLHKGVRKQKWFYFVFFAGITALSFLAGHFQMTYYATGLGVFFFIFLLVQQRKSLRMKGILKIAGFFVVGLLILGMFVSISYLQVYRNLGFGARGETKGYDYTTSWSMPTAELIDLFVPEFSGILNNYWGANYFKLNTEYFGIITLFFVLIGALFYFRNRNVKFFFFIGVIAMLLALGKHTPLFQLAYFIVPGIKKFRAPSLIFFIVTFSAVVVSAFGLKHMLDEDEKGRKVIIALSCFLGALLLFAMVGVLGRDGFGSFLKSHFSYLQVPQNAAKLRAFEGNYDFFVNGLAKAVIVTVICFICSLLLLRKRLRPFAAISVISLVLLVDLWAMGKRFLSAEDSPPVYYKADGVVNYLKQDKSLFRVFPLQYKRSNDGILIVHNIESLGGYHPNPLRRYQELVGAGESVMFSPFSLVEVPSLLNVLNGKYLIGIPLPPESLEYQYDENTRGAIQHWRQYYSNFSPVKTITRDGNLEYIIYRNDTALPRAFFVEDFRLFEEKDAVLTFMKSMEFDPTQTVLLEEEPGMPHPDSILGGSAVDISAYGINRIEVHVSASQSGFLVLSENFFPRWNAYLDDQKTKVYVANYALRAVAIPQGEHSIVFKYEDMSFTVGKILYIVALVVLLGSVVMRFTAGRRHRNR